MNGTLRGMAKSLEFSDEHEAANYIMSSRINGQHRQARKYFQSLRGTEKARCIEILRKICGDTEVPTQ